MRNVLSEIDLLSILQRTPTHIGESVYPPGGHFGPAWQRHLELVLIHTGSARLWVDDEPPVTIPAGWLALQLPHHTVHYRFDDDDTTHHTWVELHVEQWPTPLLGRFERLPPMLPISAALAGLVAEAVATTRMPMSTIDPLLASLAAAALWRYVGEAESSVRGDDAVGRARTFLHTHVDDPRIDLEQVAAAAHVSASHLVRRFRRELGVTPIAYLWERRVAIGIDLLTSTGLPVGEIATRAGFSSVYHFSRRVKAHTGLPPTEVRRMRWARRRLSPTEPQSPRG
jgi:AraC-like DNA-binding protein